MMSLIHLLSISISRPLPLAAWLLAAPAFAQQVASPIVQNISTVQSFTGTVVVKRSEVSAKQTLAKGDVGIPVGPGVEIQVGSRSTLTLKCASGQSKKFKGPLIIKVDTECPSGKPVASLGVGIDESAAIPALLPEPIRGLW